MYEIRVIDGTSEKRLDMTKPSFPYNFEANSIADLKDRSASWSYTISLPRTANNERVLGFAGTPFVNTQTPYRRLQCNVYADGLQIIDHGVLFIDSATDTEYKVQVLSGVANVFELMKDIDWINGEDWYNVHMPLTDLSEGEGSAVGVTWPTFYVAEDNGLLTSSKKNAFLMYATPRVNLQHLLDEISTRIGYTFSFPNIGILPANMYLVPTKRKNVENSAGVVIKTIQAVRPIPSPNNYCTGQVLDFTATNYTEMWGSIKNEVQQQPKVTWTKATVRIGLVSNILNSAESSYFGQGGTIRVGNTVTIDSTNWPSYRNGNDLLVTITDPSFVDITDVVASNTRWRGGDLGDWVTGVKFGRITIDYELTQTTATDQPFPGAIFPICKNLGFATAFDFFKMLCQVKGYFVTVDTTSKVIECHSMSEVVSNKPNAIDWTNKMAMQEDKELHYEFGSYGRVNTITYKQDKITGKTDASTFTIDNDKLPATKEVVSIALCSSLPTNSSRVIIYTKDGDEYKFTEGSNPHLLYKVQYTNYYYHVGASTVKAAYNDLISILQSTLVLKAKFVLSAVDIITFDNLVPIYLKQFGRYFYVNKISSWEIGKMCDVELLRI